MTPERRHRTAVWTLGAASLLIQMPFLALGSTSKNEGSILAIATELAQGEHLYRDVVPQAPPLAYELWGVLFQALGPGLLKARSLQACLLAACVTLTFLIVRRIAGLRPAVAAGIGVCALKAIGFPAWTAVDGTAAATACLLGSVLGLSVILDKPRAGLALLAGGLAAVCFFTDPAMGAALILALLLAAGIRLFGPGDAPQVVRRSGLPVALGFVLCTATIAFGFLAFGHLDETVDTIRVGPTTQVRTGTAEDAGILTQGLPRLIRAGLPALRGAIPRDTTGAAASLLPPLLDMAVALIVLVPPLLLGAGLLSSRRAPPGLARTRSILICGTALLCWATILHDPDWERLANVYPPIIAAIAISFGGVPRFASPLLAIWVMLGLLAGFAITTTQRTAVETPRGTVQLGTEQATSLVQLLEWSDGQPPDESIAFLPDRPLSYFATGRRIPLAFDRLVPWQVTPAEDERVSSELGHVDRVVLDPDPLANSPVASFAPRVAAILNRDFELAGAVPGNGLVLQRVPPTHRLVEDLIPATDPAHRRAWLTWPVAVPPEPTAAGERTCLRYHQDSQAGFHLETHALFDPRSGPAGGEGAPAPAYASIELKPAGEGWRKLFQRRIAAGDPPVSASIPLGARSVDLGLCVVVPPAAGRVAVPVGFASPRITVRAGPRKLPRPPGSS